MNAATRRLERSGVRLTGRAAALLVIVTLLGVFSAVPIRQYAEQRSRIAGLEREAARLEQANATLESEIARLRDPAELERLARECLGMVKPGEVAFVVVPKDGQPRPTSC